MGVFHLNIKSPYTIASGIVTTVPSVLARIARDVPQVGFLTTKTISLHPRQGYREPIIHEYHPGCFVNAVGLANPGATRFTELMQGLLPLHENKPLIVSIMGMNVEEFLECATVLDPIADAFELNLSCPHVKGAGQAVGSDPDAVRAIIGLLKTKLRKPVIPKLSPNLGNVGNMARLCQDAGADGLSLINTVGPGIAVDTDGNPILTNVEGGLSGAGILPVGLRAVRQAASVVDLPIIASGGISSAAHVRAYREAGASFFAFGSVLAGKDTHDLIGFFSSLEKSENGPINSLSTVETVPSDFVRTEYSKTTVVRNSLIGHDLFRLELLEGPPCAPGRFFFLRIPGIGEKPFSPMNDNPPVFLVRSVGPFTRRLQKISVGQTIYLRGPYGRGFRQPGPDCRLVLISGGTGLAPIVFAANCWKTSVSKFFAGFSSTLDEDFSSELHRNFPGISAVVDPPGQVGEVLRFLDKDIRHKRKSYDNCRVFMCGPDPLMKAAATILLDVVPKDNIVVSREDIMRCGIGICGSCGTGEGLRSCVDGPVMNLE